MPRLAKHTSASQVPPPVALATHEQVAARRPVLLWIDDFEPGLALYQVMFERLGFSVLTASSGQMGLKLAEQHPVDVVVTDFEMPKMNGEAVATAIKASKPGTPVVLFTGSTLVPQSARRAVDACCDKAGSRDQLLTTLNRLLHKKRTRTLQPPPIAPASHERHRTVA